jgi:hypothetical protein
MYQKCVVTMNYSPYKQVSHCDCQFLSAQSTLGQLYQKMVDEQT